MKTSPRVLPLFRSDGQARVLTQVFLRGGDEGVSLTEIAARANLSASAVHHEVVRLERAGLVRSRRVGRTRLVQADGRSPFHRDLTSLLLKAFGPEVVLREELQAVAGVDEAYVFGSWARRYAGESGPAPGDIDVLVVGRVDPDAVYAACRRVESRLGLEVNPVVISPTEWDTPRSTFVEHIRESELVPVVGELE